MQITIHRTEVATFITGDEPGVNIEVYGRLSESIGTGRGSSRGEALHVEVTVQRDIGDTGPLAFEPEWVRLSGYYMTTKGTRNKTKGYGRLYGAEGYVTGEVAETIAEALRVAMAEAQAAGHLPA